MNSFNFLSEAMVSALGWTLLHSLWQGALIALGVLFFLPKIKTAQHRYILAYSALLGLFFVSITTFFRVYTPEVYTLEEGVSDVVLFFQNEKLSESGQPVFDFLSHWQVVLTAWVEGNSAALLTFWFLGFAFFLTRILGGLWFLRQLRIEGLCPMPEQWLRRFELLKEKAGIRRKVLLQQSQKVDSPLALGYFKPLILFPIGLVNQLSPEQVEAALAHELAHILRQDFALNVLQSFVEALFYYHPAVWYLGDTIRAEREHCCDDFAMALCGNPLTYAKTLVEIETLQKQFYQTPQMALALSGPNNNHKKPLLQRVQRILNQPQQKNTQIMEKSIATLVLLFCLATWSINAEPAKNLFHSLGNFAEETIFSAEKRDADFADNLDFMPDYAAIPDTSEPKRIEKRIEKFKKDDGENAMEMTMENGEISELIVNGETVPKERYSEYADDIQYFKDRSGAAASGKEKRIIIIDADEDVEWDGDDAEEKGRQVRKTVKVVSTDDGVSTINISGDEEGDEHQTIVVQDGGNGSQTVRVTSNTDDKGNSVVVINNGDKKSEIKVVDGKVFMDGVEMKDGESIDVPGGEKRQRMIFIGDDGEERVIETGDDGEQRVIVIEQDGDKDWEVRWAEIEAELGENAEEVKERLREAMEKAGEEMKRVEIRMREIEEEVEERIEERKARNDKLASQSDKGEVGNAIQGKLIEEGVIKEDESFSITLTAKKLVVNGKTQSDKLHQECAQIYEDIKGDKLDGKVKVKIKRSTH